MPNDTHSSQNIEEIIEHQSHYLPSQRPLEAFVHHNTLHHFEDYSFEEGTEKAAEIFSAKPYMSEIQFRNDWLAGRIHYRDVLDVLEKRVENTPLDFGVKGLTVRDAVRRWMLHMPSMEEELFVDYLIHENNIFQKVDTPFPRDSFERLFGQGNIAHTQQQLWQLIQKQVQPAPNMIVISRPRDWILQETEIDIDDLVNPILIHWCKAYLDGEFSFWQMADRSQGFFAVMMEYFANASFLPSWMKHLKKQAKHCIQGKVNAKTALEELLKRVGWNYPEIERWIHASFLSLPGYPGMFVQLKARPDLSPFPAPPTELIDYVAVRLLLEESAARHILKSPEGQLVSASTQIHKKNDQNLAWRVYSAARLLGVRPCEIEKDETIIPKILELLLEWNDVKRRALWQNAYEKRYRHWIFDGLLAHQKAIKEHPVPKSEVQVVTCIDDREESLRRHLEEISLRYETLGFAGFYGVAMYFQGYNTPNKRPLCPAGVIPKHLVKEVLEKDVVSYSFIEHTTVGSNTLFRGTAMSLLSAFGIISLARDLFKHKIGSSSHEHQAATQLLIEASDPPEFQDGLQLGYTLDEMTNIVRKCLEDMGLTKNFAPLVITLGHGSKSLNNPHEAAHDCGACGGGRGGPNGRAFAAMANNETIRENLREVGIDIPKTTWFVGGYHNTCDDAIAYYDVENIPETHLENFRQTQKDLLRASQLDAHERCRRFESVPLDISPEDALTHAHYRAQDITEPRPEYGHCTNALCFVGRRKWSRGLFLDRRVFLTSYNPQIDPSGAILERLLASVGPVGAGINLEYYFSFVDRDKYGCNTKLPHNITSLLGVMNGQGTDLQTGLPWQMVEIHEPMRLLNIIEATPEKVVPLLEAQPYLKKLIVNRWILIALFEPETNRLWYFDEEGFILYQPEQESIPEVEFSTDWYTGRRDHLLPATTLRALRAHLQAKGGE